MDSLTQIVLGASVGEAVIGKKAGNKALLWGAVAGTIPDLDVFSRYFLPLVDSIDVHRGMTHSILFSILFAPLLGYLIRLVHSKGRVTWLEWTKLSFWSLFTHPLLDCFTTWGTQLFWPFSPYRVSFKTIFVIDPLYTLPFLAFTLWLMFKDRESRARRRLNLIGLSLSSLYLLMTVVNKHLANSAFETALSEQNINYLRYETKPTPLNSILWSVTAETAEGYHIGYYSLLDSHKNIPFHYFPKNHGLLGQWKGNRQLRTMLFITDGYYTVEKTNYGFVLNDLRFGQTTGWLTGEGDFVFAYHLIEKNGELIITQKRNSFREGARMLGQFWDRIRGV